MHKKVMKLAQKNKDEIIKIRHQIHMYPETGFEEVKTSKLVISHLEKLDIPYQKNVAKTGVIGLIEGEKEGKTIAIRADMDALELQEENDVPYKSKIDGKMHACGHDTHTAMLIGVAKILVELQDKLSGNIKLIFQPAEEGLGGAKPMVKAGALEKPKVSAAIALHVAGDLEAGKIEIKDGSLTASADEFWIDIKGKGGHAASPHETTDPIAIGAYLITSLQIIVSRFTDPVEPAVVTVGIFKAGSAHNIIPEKAHLRGTIRALDEEVRQEIYKNIQKICEGVGKTYDCTITPGIKKGYSPGNNAPELNDLIKASARELIGEENIKIADKPQMGAEDFYEFSDNYSIPVSMFWLGATNEEKGIIYPNHSPKFDVDEDVLPLGSALLALTAIKYLKQ
ncbi:MAG: amidohydrolase [Asgard group archaeon]|nr:amidohydrolase [Asgard group archaeon]